MNTIQDLFVNCFPEMAKEWDFNENKIDINSLSKRSNYRAYWKCEKGHKWKARVDSRTKRNSKCPYCAGRKAITGENDVETLYPILALQFHPTKNGGLRLNTLKESSGKRVWWICDKGHEWEAIINTRTKRGYGCPICSGQKIVSGINDFATKFPEIAKEVHPTKNPFISIEHLGGKSPQKLVWLCPNGHEYITSIAKRTGRGDGCPYCAGRYAVKGETDLETLHPEVMKYWNKDENGPAYQYTASSGKDVRWKCQKGHVWTKKISLQVKHNNCPVCAGRVLIRGENDLGTVYPELMGEWDDNKNIIHPYDIKASVNDKYWWKCKKGHSFYATIYNRLQGKGCPYCAGKLPIVGYNDLATLYPDLITEWNYGKNRKTPEMFLPKSNRRVWWKCKEGHVWRALISERTRGTGCPICYRG